MLTRQQPRTAPGTGPGTAAGPGQGTLTGAWLRKLLWRLITYLAGGLTVTGKLPTGPGIVVANHTSHADTAILFATLPARGRPFAVAAGDYWYSRWWRRLAARTVVATIPVERTTGQDAYEDLLATLRPRLQSGSLVLLFPEGTRTTTGEVGPFKTGAVRLASDLGVPLYPAAIKGVRKVLPKNGRLRPHPMEVVFHAPVTVEPAADREAARLRAGQLRQTVVDLKGDDEPPAPISRRYARTAALVSSSVLWVAAFSWGFIEALFWPLIAEAFIAFAVIVRPKRVLPAAAVLALGSAVGVCVHAWLAYRGIHAWRPLTTERMYAQAVADLSATGGGVDYFGVWHQLLSGVPVKQYGAAAGDLARVGGAAPDYVSLFWWTLVWRAARILTVGVVVAALGVTLRSVLPRWFPLVWWCGVVVFGLLLFRVYGSWQ